MSSQSESEDVQDVGFATISTGVHAYCVSPTFIEWCPTIDMVGFSYIEPDSQLESDKDDKNNQVPTGLTIHRLSSQQVWSTNTSSVIGVTGGSKKSQSVIQPLSASWNETGRMLALTLRDGSCKVYSSNTGKLMVVIKFPSSNKTFDWTSILWTTYKLPTTLTQDSPFRRLGFSTILKSLPKLTFAGLGPVLPDSQYTMRQVLEDTIHSKTADIDTFEIPVQVIGTNHGFISVNLFGTLNVGLVKLNPQQNVFQNEIVGDLSTFSDLPHVQIALTKNDANTHNLYTINMDFLTSLNIYLMDLAQVPTQISALLEYIRGEINVVRTEMSNMAKIQQNFYNPLITEFKKENESQSVPSEASIEDLVPLFLDALLTGIPSQCISNWVSQNIKERGIKKWKKEILHGYKIIRKKIFVYLIPALERMIFLLSQVNGLVKWLHNGGSIDGILSDHKQQKMTSLLSLDSDKIEKASSRATLLVRELNLYLWALNSEFLLYRSFSNWIEILYEEITNMPIRDSSGEGPKIAQTTKVKEYICDILTKVGSVPEFGLEYQGSSTEDTSSEKKAKMEVHKDNDNSRSLEHLFKSICGACESIFEVIKKSLCEQVYVSKPLKLSIEDKTAIKVRGVSKSAIDPIPRLSGLTLGTDYTQTERKDNNSKNDLWVYIAMCLESRPSELVVAKTKVSTPTGEPEPNMQPEQLIEACRIDVSLGNSNTKLLQFEFIDDQEILLLLSTKQSDDGNVDDGTEEEDKIVLASMSYFDLMYSLSSCSSDESILETVYKSCDSVMLNISKVREFTKGAAMNDSDRPRSSSSTSSGAEQSKKSNGNNDNEITVFDEFEDADDTEKREQLIENDFLPCAFSINGKAGRRVGCLLERDLHRYIFFDLDSGFDENQDDEEEDEDEDEDEDSDERDEDYENEIMSG